MNNEENKGIELTEHENYLIAERENLKKSLKAVEKELKELKTITRIKESMKKFETNLLDTKEFRFTVGKDSETLWASQKSLEEIKRLTGWDDLVEIRKRAGSFKIENIRDISNYREAKAKKAAKKKAPKVIKRLDFGPVPGSD